MTTMHILVRTAQRSSIHLHAQVRGRARAQETILFSTTMNERTMCLTTNRCGKRPRHTLPSRVVAGESGVQTQTARHKYQHKIPSKCTQTHTLRHAANVNGEEGTPNGSRSQSQVRTQRYAHGLHAYTHTVKYIAFRRLRRRCCVRLICRYIDAFYSHFSGGVLIVDSALICRLLAVLANIFYPSLFS